MTETEIREYLDRVVEEEGGGMQGSGVCLDPYYGPGEPLDHIVSLVSAASGISLSGMMLLTLQDMRNAY